MQVNVLCKGKKMLRWNQYTVQQFWIVVAFPCFKAVNSFMSWYALLLLFFPRSSSISLHCSPVQGDSKNLATSRVWLNPNSSASPEANFPNFLESHTPPHVGLEDHGRLSPGLALTSTMADPTNCCKAAPFHGKACCLRWGLGFLHRRWTLELECRGDLSTTVWVVTLLMVRCVPAAFPLSHASLQWV